MSVQLGLKELNHHPRNHHYLIRGACFLKKKARSPILKGFGKLSCGVCKFTGQQYLLLEFRFPSLSLLFPIYHRSLECALLVFIFAL